MQSALNQFEAAMGHVRNLLDLYHGLETQSSLKYNTSDLLRSALVASVSALDYYIHEVVILGVLAIYRGERAEPDVQRNATQSAFAKVQVSLGGPWNDRQEILNIAAWLGEEIQRQRSLEFTEQPHTLAELSPLITAAIRERLTQSTWLETELRERLSYQSFQQPDKIADALRSICDRPLWDTVAADLDRSSQSIKQQLREIVDRRNKIAHEADVDPSYGIGNRWPIDADMVSQTVDFVEQVVQSIHRILTEV